MLRKTKQVILLTLAMSTSINLYGCTPISTLLKLENLLEFGVVGTEPEIDENNITGELVENTLSDTKKEQERIAVKSDYTEMDKRKDELVKANGGINSSVDLNEQYVKRQEELKNDRKILSDKIENQSNKYNDYNNTDSTFDASSEHYDNFFDSMEPDDDPSKIVEQNPKEESHSIWEFLREKFNNWYEYYKLEHE